VTTSHRIILFGRSSCAAALMASTMVWLLVSKMKKLRLPHHNRASFAAAANSYRPWAGSDNNQRLTSSDNADENQ